MQTSVLSPLRFYAIGIAKPVSLYVNTFGKARVDMTDAEISEKVAALVDMSPYAIEKRLNLRTPMYRETAAYGHVGRKPVTVRKSFASKDCPVKDLEVKLFTWEELDLKDMFCREFGLSEKA